MSKEVKWKLIKEYDDGKVWEQFRPGFERSQYWVQLGRYKNPPTEKQMDGWKDVKTKNVAYRFLDRTGALMFADLLLNLRVDEK